MAQSKKTSELGFSPSPLVARVAAVILGVFACAGELVYFFGGSGAGEDIGPAMILLLAFSSAAGIASILGVNPWREDFATGHYSAPSPSHESYSRYAPTFMTMAIVAGIQAVIALAAAILCLGMRVSDDYSLLFAPLLLAGLVGGFGQLAGWLIGMLVVWPIVELMASLWRLATHRPVEEPAAAAAALFLTIIPGAIFVALSTPNIDTSGLWSLRGAGTAHILDLFRDYSQTGTTAIYAWVARALVVLFTVEVVWLGFAVKRTRLAQAERLRDGGTGRGVK